LRELSGQAAARAPEHFLGQAPAAAALRDSLLRDAGGLCTRGFSDHAPVRAGACKAPAAPCATGCVAL